MSPDHYIPDGDPEHRQIGPRPAPRCYVRQAMSKTVRRSRIDAEGNAIVIALSIITCVAAFVLISGGWSV